MKAKDREPGTAAENGPAKGTGPGVGGEAASEPVADPPASFISLGFTHAPLAALGPGRRVGVWTSGCDLRCPGCIAPELQEARPEGFVPAEELAGWVVATSRREGLAGLTVSGGEPFFRPEALRLLLELSREGGVGDVLVYSGRRASELVKAFPWVPELVTALVDGPFEEGRPSSRPWKGSEGQSLTVFGGGDLGEAYSRWEASDDRPLQFAPFEGGVRILGIPAIGSYDSIPIERGPRGPESP
ncbi:MAG: radical SAM protein [Deltaproteobacteria bacterium]|nr:radical SAM protein [Deltaproteobacteria bacterium]